MDIIRKKPKVEVAETGPQVFAQESRKAELVRIIVQCLQELGYK